VNRKKKISDIYNKKLKKAKSHLNPKANNTKPRYISKAEREQIALEEAQSHDQPTEQVAND
jgi:hypothetical protein